MRERIMIKRECKELYLKGERKPEVLMAKSGKSMATIYRWLSQWDKLYSNEQKLDEKIKFSMKKALCKGLESYSDDPGNKGLQSLVSLLKQHMQLQEPSKELNQYILKFMDQVITYFIEINDEEMRERFQEHVVDLSEYLRRKNNG